jgi:hypothetical protein
MDVFHLFKCPFKCIFVGSLFALHQNKLYPFCLGGFMCSYVLDILSMEKFYLYTANKRCIFWTENKLTRITAN